MVRATLDAGSPHAMAMLTPGAGAAMHFRQLADTPTTTEPFEPVAAPVWLKLARLGGTFMAYWSADGTTWELLGQANVPMPQAVFIGLALGAWWSTRLRWERTPAWRRVAFAELAVALLALPLVCLPQFEFLSRLIHFPAARIVLPLLFVVPPAVATPIRRGLRSCARAVATQSTSDRMATESLFMLCP